MNITLSVFCLTILFANLIKLLLDSNVSGSIFWRVSESRYLMKRPFATGTSIFAATDEYTTVSTNSLALEKEGISNPVASYKLRRQFFFGQKMCILAADKILGNLSPLFRNLWSHTIGYYRRSVFFV